ncbi:MAG: alpha/beta hydrolase [Bdellovibrionales bacterium]|jgi:alpha-beta hydrolase superfamily lysophospholipase|nr:alpha/beta hydrolase [Bdellovibrionales bacterium]
MIKKGYLNTSNHKVFYKYFRLLPTRKATDVAFIIQGRNETTEMYDHVVNQLQHYLKVDIVLFDLPGQGHSSGEKFHINSYQEDYMDVFSNIFHYFKGDSNHIIGHSTGALIAMTFALENKVNEMVLTSPFMALYNYPFFLPKIEALSSFICQLPFLKKTSSQRSRIVPFEQNNLTNCRELYDRFNKGGPPTWNWLYEITKAQEFLRKNISRLTTPTLAILAGDDSIVDNFAFKELAEQMNPKPDIIEFENEKHALFISPLQTQEKIIKVISEFIASQSPSTSQLY